jgi:Pentapeptide repeats (8 copies)
MKVRIHREKPDPWEIRRQRIKHIWTTPFWAFEWSLEWVAFVLSRWTFLDVLEYLEGFSVLIAVIFYFSESGDRIKQKHYQAWQVINTAQGKGGSGGRIEALQELNRDRVPLVGVDASGAFLQDVHLEHAPLLRSNFSDADLRDSHFNSADFSDADLRSANFRASHLEGAAFQRADMQEADLTDADLRDADLSGANLNDADLTNANLANFRWRNIAGLKNANLFGVKNPPEGFLTWAKQQGAVQTVPDPSQ